MKKLLVLMSALLIASSAMAVVDTDPNGIGIYFDMTADTNYMDAAAGDMIPCYLIVSNATSTSIGGWECSIEWNEAAAFVAGAWTYEGTHLNVYTEPDFAVGLAVPIPTSDATLLVSCTLFVSDPVGTLLTVGPAPDPSTPDNLPLYVDGVDLNQLVLLSNSTGYNPDGSIPACASINVGLPDDVSATEDRTWSSVKSLW